MGDVIRLSQRSSVLSQLCQRTLPNHPRLAAAFAKRLAALDVSRTTADRFLKTFLEIELSRAETRDIDSDAERILGSEIPDHDYRPLAHRMSPRGNHLIILALRLNQRFSATAEDGITDVEDRTDVSQRQVDELLRLFVSAVAALHPFVGSIFVPHSRRTYSPV